MPKAHPPKSKKAMNGEEFRYIRLDVLELTQDQLRRVLHRGIDRISSWENDRCDIPKLVASHMRLLAKQ